MVKWRTGETITKSLIIIIGDDTFTSALYTNDVQEKG